MALLKVEAEMARAQPENAFPETDGFGRWMELWCHDCIHEMSCPLLLVVVLNRTPAAWTLRDGGTVNKYSCAEFEKPDADRVAVIEDGEAPAM